MIHLPWESTSSFIIQTGLGGARGKKPKSTGYGFNSSSVQNRVIRYQHNFKKLLKKPGVYHSPIHNNFNLQNDKLCGFSLANWPIQLKKKKKIE